MWRADGFNIKMSCWHAFQCSRVSQNQLLLIGRSKAHLWHWTLKSFPSITDSVNSRCEECVWEKMIRWNVHAHHIDIFCSWYVVDKRKWTTNLVMEAMRRQRDTPLVPTQILFSSQTTTKMCPRVHDESTTLNNKCKRPSPFREQKKVHFTVKVLLLAGTDGQWGEDLPVEKVDARNCLPSKFTI